MKKNFKTFDISKEVVSIQAKLPVLPKKPRKNLFEILRVQHREIYNSNILAFFLNPTEEHGFGFLFSEALQEVAMEKIILLNNSHPHLRFNDISSFDEVKTVVTEEYTTGAAQSTKSIDIVLEGDDWIIGIENKIHHYISNPLNTYWEHLNSKKKTPFGVLLTLFPTSLDYDKFKNGECFLNITHKDLLNKVQQNIRLSGESNATDIFYLREYYKNVESHYYHLNYKPEMDALILEITKNYDAINNILKKKAEAESHIERQINSVFSNYGYIKVNKWFRREDKKFDLYFYLPPASELMRTNSLWLCLEIRNGTNKKIDRNSFKKHFKEMFEDLTHFEQIEMESNSERTHAFIYIKRNFFNSETTFKSNFQTVMNHLTHKDNSPVNVVETYLEDKNHFFTG